MSGQKIALTGDRPSGRLHVGHFVGSLQSRLEIQDKFQQFIMIADVQALTDNYKDPKKINENVLQLAIDYLSVGIDPNKSTVFIQSMIPEIAELAIYYLNLVTVARLKRNPTVKAEILQKGFGESVPAGFLVYPVHQAADITIVRADYVPVGADQLPMIEQTNEIVRAFNRIYGEGAVKTAEPIVSHVPRLVGIDGKSKMSKSLGNAIYISDEPDMIRSKVGKMYTDPGHLKISDPGKIEGNAVFEYLDAFDKNKEELEELKAHYQRGGLGDVTLKKRLAELIIAKFENARARRRELERDLGFVQNVLRRGTERTREVAARTMADVRDLMYLNHLS